MKSFLVGLFLLPSLFSAEYQYELALGSMFRDEAPYLKEWIEYHRRVGVDHFWLYDNCSWDDWESVLKPYIEEGIVEVFDWKASGEDKTIRNEKFPMSLQMDAFYNSLMMSRGKAKWFGFIDLDEFILPMRNKTVPECLNEHYSEAAAVFASWLNFGTSKVFLKEGESILLNLTRCALRGNIKNGNGKSLLRPDFVDLGKLFWHHYAALVDGAVYMDGDKNILHFNGSQMDWNWKFHDKYIRINHYFTRDENFFSKKRIAVSKNGSYSVAQLEDQNQQMNLTSDKKMINFLRSQP